MGELLNMTKKNLDRYLIIQKVLKKEITQKIAARLLNIGDRQIRNILKTYRNQEILAFTGIEKRGGNNRKPKALRNSILSLLKEKYEGFGPTLACEKLCEHNIKISVETLRNWMIHWNLWIPRKQRKKLHLPRNRRECFGELIQADGSHHHWFGEKLPKANATVLVDDATSKITGLVFSKEETTEAYFEALEQHVENHGIPRALYTDQYSVFQTTKKKGETQMQRALKEIDCELILANSPQAKGRVERANRTLQDRLVKEFKLNGITTIEEANAFAPIFLENYNKKFSKKPMRNLDAHRSKEGYDLKQIFSLHETRTLLSDCTFQYNKKIFVAQNISDTRRAKGQKIKIKISRDGAMKVYLKEKELEVKELSEIASSPVLSRKGILAWKSKGQNIPPKSHPWKKFNRQGCVTALK